ncbi:MAG: lactate dehydrogenase [Eubacteriales bacterium]|nr:lactate dehydrogenase [Eubacteriales bacterium]
MLCFYRYHEYCLCPFGGALPEGAEKTDALFSPLVILISRDPLVSRGMYAIHDLTEMEEPEDIRLLLPLTTSDSREGIARFIAENGARVVNTSFLRWARVLRQYDRRMDVPKKINIIGLGNVGGTAATALKLLGTDLDTIGLFDADQRKCLRYEGELNQILPLNDGERLPRVVLESMNRMFECDALLFTAARSVPDVGEENGADVRMMQYKANRELLRDYTRLARIADFAGLFAQVSDPVDQLSRAVFLMSNQDDRGEFDWNGLLPEQVRGFGLGVMQARAVYCAEKERVRYQKVCSFGPHGKGLVVANAPNEGYDEGISQRLTKKTEEANLEIRKSGFKPYLAPGISSVAVSVLRALRGEWHSAAVPIGGVYFGCSGRFGKNGPEILRQPLHRNLFRRIEASYMKLQEFNETWDK